MKGQNVVFSAANRSDAENSSDNWRTPRAIIDLCVRIFDGPIELDPCADSDPRYHFAITNYTAEDNGLIQPWCSWRTEDWELCRCPCHLLLSSDVPNANSRTRRQRSTSQNNHENKTGSIRGVKTATENALVQEWQRDAPIPMNRNESEPKSSATLPPIKDALQSDEAAKQKISAGENNAPESSTSGFGPPQIGNAALTLGYTSAPIAEELANSNQITLSRSPHLTVPEASLGTSFLLASHVAAVKDVKALNNGLNAQTPQSSVSSTTCSECENCTKVPAKSVFVNMPYSQAYAWNKRLIAHYKRGDLDEALVLMAARTDTAKWRTLANEAPIMCLIRGRVIFDDPREVVTHCDVEQPRLNEICDVCGKKLSSSAGFPSALFYLGYRMEWFAEQIQEAQLGQLWTPYR